MKDDARPVEAMVELPRETREFLARLRPDDLETLEDGVRLVNSIRTVGTFMRWLLIGTLGIVVGVQVFWDFGARLLGNVRHWFGG